MQHAWNVVKTSHSRDENFESKFEKAFYELIQTMEFQQKYRLTLEMLKKHVKRINDAIREFIKRDENDKKLKEKIDKLTSLQKEVKKSAKEEKDGLKDKIKTVLENSGEKASDTGSFAD